jgi:hypothetical protein
MGISPFSFLFDSIPDPPAKIKGEARCQLHAFFNRSTAPAAVFYRRAGILGFASFLRNKEAKRDLCEGTIPSHLHFPGHFLL